MLLVMAGKAVKFNFFIMTGHTTKDDCSLKPQPQFQARHSIQADQKIVLTMPEANQDSVISFRTKNEASTKLAKHPLEKGKSNYLSEQIRILTASIGRDIQRIQEEKNKKEKEVKETSLQILDASKKLEKGKHSKQIKIQNEISESRQEIENLQSEIGSEELSIEKFKTLAIENDIVYKYEKYFSNINKGLKSKKEELDRLQDNYQKILKENNDFHKELRVDITGAAVRLHFSSLKREVSSDEVEFWRSRVEQEKICQEDNFFYKKDLKTLEGGAEKFQEISQEINDKINEISRDIEETIEDKEFLERKNNLEQLAAQIENIENGIFSFESRLAKKDAELSEAKKELKEFIQSMEVSKRIKEVLVKAKSFYEENYCLSNIGSQGYKSEKFRPQRDALVKRKESLQKSIKEWYEEVRQRIQSLKDIFIEELQV